MKENIKRLLEVTEKQYKEIRKEKDLNLRLGRLEGLVEFVIMYSREEVK